MLAIVESATGVHHYFVVLRLIGQLYLQKNSRISKLLYTTEISLQQWEEK